MGLLPFTMFSNGACKIFNVAAEVVSLPNLSVSLAVYLLLVSAAGKPVNKQVLDLVAEAVATYRMLTSAGSDELNRRRAPQLRSGRRH